VEVARKEVHEVSNSLLLVQSSLEETQELLHRKELLVRQQEEELVNKAQQVEEFRLKVRGGKQALAMVFFSCCVRHVTKRWCELPQWWCL